MGKVKTTWLMPGHSGSPCHHDSIYTKLNRRTGQVYSVKLCNPNDNVTANVAAQRTKFGTIASALSAWINANKVSTATDHATYQRLFAAFNRQNKYSTLRGYMMARNMAEVQADGSVKVTIGTYSTTVAAGVVNNGTGGNGPVVNPGSNPGSGSGSGTQTGGGTGSGSGAGSGENEGGENEGGNGEGDI